MTEFEKTLSISEFVGIVEDNNDPDKKQRVRIRIPYLHGDKDKIPTDALPWAQPFRDNNGLEFSIPDLNKIINVKFPTGNLYYPLYINAQHLNLNLQNKIEELDGDDYTSFVAFCYNHNTQIFFNNNSYEQYFKKNGFKIDEDNIIMKRRDSSVKMYMGSEDADEPIMLGNKFVDWLDSLVEVLIAPYIGNNGVDVIPSPDLIKVISEYYSKKQEFLSKNIFAINNTNKTKNDIKVEGQIGDAFSITKPVSSSLNVEQSIITQSENADPEDNVQKIIVDTVKDKPPVVNMPKTTPDILEAADNETEPVPEENKIKVDPVDLNTNNDENSESDDSLFYVDENATSEYGEDDYDFYAYLDEDEIYSDETTNYSSSLDVLDDSGKSTAGLGFNYSSFQFVHPDINTKYESTYLRYVDHDKLPNPKLNKSKLVNWKLSAEGGISNDPGDSASKKSENICPTPYKGKQKIHTNKGVTYSVWKSVFGKKNDKRFLEMSHEDWETVFDKKYWNKHASSNYESVNCLLVSYAWGGNKPKCVEQAQNMLGGKLTNFTEKEQIAALLSARYQFFINISDPSYANNKYRKGWVNAINNLVKRIYA